MLIRVNYDSTTWRQILEQMELLPVEEQQVRICKNVVKCIKRKNQLKLLLLQYSSVKQKYTKATRHNITKKLRCLSDKTAC
jgi:hypothetical protein